MKPFLLMLLISSLCFSQERLVKGIVQDESGPLPGATIVIKGSTIGTTSNFDGEFEILVPHPFTVLTISFVGMATTEINIDKSKTDKFGNIIVLLEGTICYLGPHYIALSYYGGLKNSNLGFQIELMDPFPKITRFTSQIIFGFQKKKENTQVNLEINLPYVFRINFQRFKLSSKFNHIKIARKTDFRSYLISTGTHFNLFNKYYSEASFGLGHSTLNKDKNMGLSIDFSQTLPLNFELKMKSTFWMNYWQYESAVSWGFDNFRLFYHFNTLKNYSEHNIGIGFRFHT